MRQPSLHISIIKVNSMLVYVKTSFLIPKSQPITVFANLVGSQDWESKHMAANVFE